MRTDRRLADEAGFALPGAMLAMIVLMSLAMLFMATAVAEMGATEDQRQYQSALPAAEAAVETLMARLVNDPSYTSKEVGSGEVHELPTDEDMEQWVTKVSARDPDLLKVPGGQAYFLGPFTDAGGRFAYGVGIVGDEVRSVRVDLGTADFEMDAALLVRGDLSITGGNGPDEYKVNGNVHANGNVSKSGGGDIGGTLTASGSSCGGCSAGWRKPEAPESDFAFSALDLYDQHVKYRPALGTSAEEYEWYDLCPGGLVKLLPYESTESTEPCQGTAIGNHDTGWEYKNGAWEAKNLRVPAVYYVHKGNASIKGATDGIATTVIVERDSSLTSSAGSLTAMKRVGYKPFMEDLLFVAEGDVLLNSNFSGFGAVLAGGQVEMSGNAKLQGGVIARSDNHEQLKESSLSGGARIEYREMSLPLPGATAVDAWREL